MGLSSNPEARARQLANLQPFTSGNQKGGGNHVGPLIGPAIRRYAKWPLAKLMALDLNKLPVYEAIALTYVYEALKSSGERARAEVTERLDGRVVQAVEVDDKREPAYIEELRRIRERLGKNEPMELRRVK